MRKPILFLLILIFMWSSSAYANNCDTFGIGSKATAMGGAYSAYAADPFAVYYNPAGLTQIESMTFSAGAAYINPDMDVNDYTVKVNDEVIMGPADFEDESESLVAPHIGFAMPITDKISLGIAVYSPFGLHIEWDKTNDPVANPAAYNSHESWYLRKVVTPSIAYKVNNKLSLGFGVSIGQSESGAYVNSYSLYQSGITATLEGDLEDDINYSWNAGVLYKPVKSIAIGLTYRGRTEADFEGSFKLTELNETDKSKLAAIGITKFEYSAELKDVDHPEQLQFGIKYSPNPKVNIEADLVWTKWSIVENQTVVITDADDPIYLLLGSNKDSFRRNWEDTRQIKLGLEYLINDMFALRCGYFYDPTPIPDDTFDVVWPDADKKTYSVGLGVNLKKWTIDTHFQYTRSEMDRNIGGESSNLNHSYDRDHHAHTSVTAKGRMYGYGVTVSYKF